MAFKRDSKFELLRIISMIFIIISHFSMYGNYNFKLDTLHTFKIMQFQPFGQIGVYLFIMISGYFLSNRHIDLRNIWEKIKSLWTKVLVYSIIILILTFVFKTVRIGIRDYITSFLPIIFSQYWFMTCFFILMFLTPLLNHMVQKLSRSTLLFYIMLIVFVADIMFLFNGLVQPFGNQFSVSVMISSYLIAAYLRKYKISIKTFYSILIILIGLFLQYLSIFILSYLRSDDKNFVCHFTYGIFPLISAVGIFLIFLNIKSFYSKIINFFASSVLAAYLITTHQLFANYFWNNIMHVARLQYSNLFTLYGIIISILVVLACCLIDKIYVLLSRSILSMKIKGRK